MIIMFIKMFLLSYVITRFEPIQLTIDSIIDSIKNKTLKSILVLINFLSCQPCCIFWLSLYMTHNLYLSCLYYFLTTWYDKLITPYEKRIRF